MILKLSNTTHLSKSFSFTFSWHPEYLNYIHSIVWVCFSMSVLRVLCNLVTSKCDKIKGFRITIIVLITGLNSQTKLSLKSYNINTLKPFMFLSLFPFISFTFWDVFDFNMHLERCHNQQTISYHGELLRFNFNRYQFTMKALVMSIQGVTLQWFQNDKLNVSLTELRNSKM